MLLIFLLLGMTAVQGADFKIVEQGQLNVEKPAFLTLTDDNILISSFKLFGRDHIFSLQRDLGALRAKPAPQVLSDKISWPNEVTPVDVTEFGQKGYLVASGFLLPGKSTGAISFINQNGDVKKLTKDKTGFFYHRFAFVDFSNTGRHDIITARSKIPLSGKAQGELVLLQKPVHPLDDEWTEKIFAQGPDIHFRLFKDAKSKSTFLIAAEFSAQKLELFSIDEQGILFSRIIDSHLGHPFDLELVDLNHDGKLDLLVTNHEHDSSAAVIAYEMPEDLKHGVWTKHILLQGIETRQKGFNQASPGAAKAFYPQLANQKSKPWILVSGDGSQRVHLLIPQNEESQNWNYMENIILDTKSTVGEPLIYDFDGDGLADFVIPAYDRNLVFFLSVKPSGQ